MSFWNLFSRFATTDTGEVINRVGDDTYVTSSGKVFRQIGDNIIGSDGSTMHVVNGVGKDNISPGFAIQTNKGIDDL